MPVKTKSAPAPETRIPGQCSCGRVMEHIHHDPPIPGRHGAQTTDTYKCLVTKSRKASDPSEWPELTTQTLESAAVKAALVLQLAAEKRESDLRARLTKAIKALETTAGNIRSLRAAGNCTTYDCWLEVVEAELPAVKACPNPEVRRG